MKLFHNDRRKKVIIKKIRINKLRHMVSEVSKEVYDIYEISSDIDIHETTRPDEYVLEFSNHMSVEDFIDYLDTMYYMFRPTNHTIKGWFTASDKTVTGLPKGQELMIISNPKFRTEDDSEYLILDSNSNVYIEKDDDNNNNDWIFGFQKIENSENLQFEPYPEPCYSGIYNKKEDHIIEHENENKFISNFCNAPLFSTLIWLTRKSLPYIALTLAGVKGIYLTDHIISTEENLSSWMLLGAVTLGLIIGAYHIFRHRYTHKKKNFEDEFGTLVLTIFGSILVFFATCFFILTINGFEKEFHTKPAKIIETWETSEKGSTNYYYLIQIEHSKKKITFKWNEDKGYKTGTKVLLTMYHGLLGIDIAENIEVRK